ncbi:MAG: molybdate ABC transporter substrate-binding protein [Lentisphaeria bacterium]|nr:molybdate ABC transporter substrate-binding protein [Lentisphaeria bacterium]
MTKAKIIFSSLLLLMLAAILLLFNDVDKEADKSEPLVLFCAAGMEPAVKEILLAYEKESGMKVDARYDGSGVLLTSLKISNRADLYLAGDYSYIDLAQKDGLVKESIPLLKLRAGLAVAKGNPKKIKSLKDLSTRSDLRIALALPEAASVGKFTKKVLQKSDLWESIEGNVQKNGTFSTTVNDLGNKIKLGSMDVAIVWDAVAAQYDEVDFISVDEFDTRPKHTTLGITTASTRPALALHLARYIAAHDRGMQTFKEKGYKVVQGDTWKNKPEIIIFSGGMLRPALEKLLKEFEQREGIIINRTFNGCGILVSQMKAGATPDAYFSCDISFMEDVQERFEKSTILTSNDMVLVVPKGNPKKITGLKDLGNKGFRLGVGHPEKSALGKLTQDMLKKANLYETIKANITVDSATGDFLVNQISLHSLDAVIIYRSNYMASPTCRENCEIIEIDKHDSKALQPYAIAKDSKHKQLLLRLSQHVEKHKKSFTSLGFEWELDKQNE